MAVRADRAARSTQRECAAAVSSGRRRERERRRGEMRRRAEAECESAEQRDGATRSGLEARAGAPPSSPGRCRRSGRAPRSMQTPPFSVAEVDDVLRRHRADALDRVELLDGRRAEADRAVGRAGRAAAIAPAPPARGGHDRPAGRRASSAARLTASSRAVAPSRRRPARPRRSPASRPGGGRRRDRAPRPRRGRRRPARRRRRRSPVGPWLRRLDAARRRLRRPQRSGSSARRASSSATPIAP